MSARVYCANCEAQLAPGARFCMNCGQEHNHPAPGQLQAGFAPKAKKAPLIQMSELRGFSYFVLVVNGLLLLATLTGFSSRTEAGQTFGFLLDLIAWAAIDVILLTIWFVTDR